MVFGGGGEVVLACVWRRILASRWWLVRWYCLGMVCFVGVFSDLVVGAGFSDLRG